MSGDKLRASGWVPIRSDAASYEVVEAVNGLGKEAHTVSMKMTLLAEHVEEKMGAVHKDIALLREHVVRDLMPRVSDSERRVGEVEKSTASKVGGAALGGVKITVYVTAAIAVLGALAKQWPWLQAVADALKGLAL